MTAMGVRPRASLQASGRAKGTEGVSPTNQQGAQGAVAGWRRRSVLLAPSLGLLPATTAHAAAPRPLAVVTGVSPLSIGGAVAAALAASGYDVLCASRDPDAAAEAAARLGPAGLALPMPLELSDPSSALLYAEAAAEAAGARGGVAALVLAAGVVAAPGSSAGPGGLEPNFVINHLGHFALARALLPELRARGGGAGGRVVVLSSTACLDLAAPLDLREAPRADPKSGAPARARYAESKAMNVLFADALAAREGRALWAYSAAPGPTATLGVRYELPRRYEQRRGMTAEQLGRQARQLGLRTPEEAAGGLLGLAVATPPPAPGFYQDEELVPGAEWAPWRTPEAAEQLWALSESLLP